MEELNTIRFVGAGAPSEALAKQRERIEEVRRHKNEKARQAADRADGTLARLGLSKAERRALGKRQRTAEVKKPTNYRWSPEVQS